MKLRARLRFPLSVTSANLLIVARPTRVDGRAAGKWVRLSDAMAKARRTMGWVMVSHHTAVFPPNPIEGGGQRPTDVGRIWFVG
ncbi:MAG: hypothetical protein LC776_04465 [Acidobacteria bacterium]|nr:hypothetical protein [Acidobacteriota bacterium]